MKSPPVPPFVVLLLAFLISACSAPVAPTAAPTQAPDVSAPQPTAAPTQPPAAPPPSATPAEDAAYPAPAEATPAAPAYPGPTEAAPAGAVPGAAQPAAAARKWVADGIISADEYAQSTKIGPVTLWWDNNAEFLYLAAEARTKGWLAVGLDPEDRMKGANFVMAAFDGDARIIDAFGTAPTGAAHPADTTLGGTDDIWTYAVVEQGGITRFEVQIPLDSGDDYDKPLKPGETYRVIVAMGTLDAFEAPHSYRGAGSITLVPAP